MGMESERWNVRDSNVKLAFAPDFLTGARYAMRPALSGSVNTLIEAKNIVEMFGGVKYVHLDYWPENHSPILIVVGTSLNNRWALERLKKKVVQADDMITPEIVSNIRKEFPVKPRKKAQIIKGKHRAFV